MSTFRTSSTSKTHPFVKDQGASSSFQFVNLKSIVLGSVSDPSHFDVDPDPDPGINIW